MAAPVVSSAPESRTEIATAKTWRLRFLTWAALVLVIIGGVWSRLNHIDKSIWSAEAWVANSVLTDTVGEIFHYKDWLQTTPPLFLLILRGTVRVAGVSVGSFRAVPFGFSILSLILTAWLARRLLQPAFAVICTTLVALSPPAVVFSKEVKQYTGDVAASCLLLIACWTYIRLPDGKRYFFLCAALVLALLLSYPAVTFIPVAMVIVAAKPSPAGSRTETRFRRLVVLTILSAMICALNYWFFVRPNTSALLTDYWSAGYPHFGHFSALVSFYARYFLGMGVYFYVPIGTKDFLISKVSAASMAVILLTGAAVVGLTGFAIARLRHDKRLLCALALCFGPLVSLAALNILHLYPVNSRRLTLFMLPCISLAAAIVLQSLYAILSNRLKPSTTEALSAALIAACVLVVFFAAAQANRWGNYWFEDENTAAAFRYLRSHAAPEDTIYIHASIEEAAKLYFRILRWSPYDVRYGNTGWGCCTRKPEPAKLEPALQRPYVLHDFESVLFERRVGQLWIISTTRSDHWDYLGRNELKIIDQYLLDRGCHKNDERQFANETAEEFACTGVTFRVGD